MYGGCKSVVRDLACDQTANTAGDAAQHGRSSGAITGASCVGRAGLKRYEALLQVRGTDTPTLPVLTRSIDLSAVTPSTAAHFLESDV